MKLSKFYKKVKVEKNTWAIFNSLMLDIRFVKENAINAIEEGHIDCVNKKELKEIGIYVDSDSDDDQALDYFREMLNYRIGKIDTVFVVPTTICNLNCSYCFIKRNEDNIKHEYKITNNLIDTFISDYIVYIKKEGIQEATIIFYGGEPIITWDKIEYFISKTKDYGLFNYIIITNGTLLSEEMLTYAESNNIQIAISIDGPKNVTDKYRKYIDSSNRSVYDIVMSNLMKIKSRKIKYNLSITISNAVLENQEEFIDWMVKNEYTNISYNLMKFNCSEEFNENYYHEATKFIIKSYIALKDIGGIDDRIFRKLAPFVNKHFNYSECPAMMGTQITLKPDGSITSCQGDLQTNKNILGLLNHNTFSDIVNNKNRLDYVNYMTLYNDECLKCEAISICGGSCYLHSKKVFGSESEIDRGNCLYSKLIFDWMLKWYYNLDKE